jgi:cyclophilin family peptidyl-prolyl cis-trans isomerase
MTNEVSKIRERRRNARKRQKKIRRLWLIAFVILIVGAITWMIVGTIINDDEVSMPELIGTKEYSSAPPMLIDLDKKYQAVITLEKGGLVTIDLYPEKAPVTVNNFIFLAREKYFDGVTFHRVIDGFMAQAGDPTGTGSGGPGYFIKNEVSDLQFDKAGVVAMANSGIDRNGSQFFITFGPVSLSPSEYTIFGQVIEGMEYVAEITRRDPTKAPDFVGDVITSIGILEE